MSDEEKTIAFPSEDLGIRRLAEPSRALRNGIEHWLDFRRRARDHLQDVAGGRLLLQRLLRLVEQPHVLDGNDGLVGEGLEEFDLLVRERVHFDSANQDCPDWLALAHQRCGQYGALVFAHDPREFSLGQATDVLDVNRTTFDDRPSSVGITIYWDDLGRDG